MHDVDVAISLITHTKRRGLAEIEQYLLFGRLRSPFFVLPVEFCSSILTVCAESKIAKLEVEIEDVFMRLKCLN